MTATKRSFLPVQHLGVKGSHNEANDEINFRDTKVSVLCNNNDDGERDRSNSYSLACDSQAFVLN